MRFDVPGDPVLPFAVGPARSDDRLVAAPVARITMKATTTPPAKTASSIATITVARST